MYFIEKDKLINFLINIFKKKKDHSKLNLDNYLGENMGNIIMREYEIYYVYLKSLNLHEFIYEKIKEEWLDHFSCSFETYNNNFNKFYELYREKQHSFTYDQLFQYLTSTIITINDSEIELLFKPSVQVYVPKLEPVVASISKFSSASELSASEKNKASSLKELLQEIGDDTPRSEYVKAAHNQKKNINTLYEAAAPAPPDEEQFSKLLEAKVEAEVEADAAERKNLEEIAKLAKETESVPLSEEAAEVYNFGLKNTDNTCYLNASIQLLWRIENFREFILRQNYTETEKQRIQTIINENMRKIRENKILYNIKDREDLIRYIIYLIFNYLNSNKTEEILNIDTLGDTNMSNQKMICSLLNECIGEEGNIKCNTQTDSALVITMLLGEYSKDTEINLYFDSSKVSSCSSSDNRQRNHMVIFYFYKYQNQYPKQYPNQLILII